MRSFVFQTQVKRFFGLIIMVHADERVRMGAHNNIIL